MRRAVTRCLLSASLVVAQAVPAATPSADEFAYCTTCHGTEGNGNAAIRAPKIAGMPPWYLERQLDAFRSGWRGLHEADQPGHEMRPVATALSDDRAVARAVAYVQTFAPLAPPATVHGDVAQGSTLYAPCAGCHGARGEGNEALAAPMLAAQNDWYLVAQLKAYRDGRRGMHVDDVRGAAMRAVTVDMTDAAIDDVVAYIDTLH
jgi:cytochrome c oxidase subunit II